MGLHAFTLLDQNISKNGFNGVVVICETYIDANKLHFNEQLVKEGQKVWLPQKFITSIGIVRNVGFSVPEDLLTEFKERYRIVEAHHLNRRVVDKDNMSYVVRSIVFCGANHCILNCE